jgi:ribosomal protein S18 acetylase RimI-like enzyme
VSISLRDAAIDDARAIAEVHVGSWRWAYRGQLPDETLDALDVTEREAGWLGVLAADDGRVLVADRGDRVVGFASIGPTRDDGAPDGTGELYAIYVTPDAAGIGVGRQLLAGSTTALEEAGFERATLWVLETNERARRFYERWGWTWDGTTSSHQVECSNLPIVRYARALSSRSALPPPVVVPGQRGASPSS